MKKRRITIIALLCFILGIVVGSVISLEIYNYQKIKVIENEDIENCEQNTNSQFLEIETPYCTLYYPNLWENVIEIEKIEDEIYIVKFSVTLEGKGKQHLFDIVFNDEDKGVGYFNTKDGKINVNMISVDILFDDTWTEVEKNRIYAMQEEANSTLELLRNQPGFKEY